MVVLHPLSQHGLTRALLSATLIGMDKKSVLLGFAVVFGIGAGVGMRLLLRRAPSPVAVETAPAAAPAPPSAPEAPLPSLEESTDFLRAKAAACSTDARWGDWLKTEDLLRRAAAAIDLIAAGKVPRDALSFLSPRKTFPLQRIGGNIFADPAGYARYDRTTEVLAAINAPAAAKILKDLSPLFEQACREFGGSSCAYPGSFARAAGRLLETPPAEERPRLKPAEKGIVFAYADERLERLSPAQKQLLRMGPKNQARIQAKLQEIVLALGTSAR